MAPTWSNHLARPSPTVALCRQGGHQLGGGGVDVGFRDGAVDHLPLGGFGAVDHAAEVDHLAGAHVADPAREEPGVAAVGGEPAVDERRPEARVVGGDGEVGRQREVEADAGGPAAHRAHHRDLHRAQQRDEAVCLRRETALDAPGARLDAGLLGFLVARHPVETGAEVLAGAGEQDRPHRFVAPGEVDRVDGGVHHRVVQRVALVWAGQAQREHTVGELDVETVDRLVRAHRPRSCGGSSVENASLMVVSEVSRSRAGRVGEADGAVVA